MQVSIASHVSAEDLHVPGMGRTLQGAGRAISDLADQAESLAGELRHTKPDADERGYATRAVRGLARRTAEALEGDARQLRSLAEAVGAEADALIEVQATSLDAMRQRWRQAKQALVQAVELQQHQARVAADAQENLGGHGGHHGGHHAGRAVLDQLLELNGHQLARRIEAGIVAEHAALWKRCFGWLPLPVDGPEQALAVIDGTPLDQALTHFRQTVRQVMDEWAGHVHRLDNLDQAVQHRLERKPIAVAHLVHEGDGPDPTMVSGPAALRDLGRDLQDRAKGLGTLVDRVHAISPDLSHGRSQPEEDRGARNNQAFEQSWTDHFRDLRQNFGPVAEEAARIAEEMLRLDQEGARSIRQLFKD